MSTPFRRLTPRLVQTARSLWLIYIGLTVACLLLLRLAGMNWFDAACHAFSALSLSGVTPPAFHPIALALIAITAALLWRRAAASRTSA